MCRCSRTKPKASVAIAHQPGKWHVRDTMKVPISIRQSVFLEGRIPGLWQHVLLLKLLIAARAGLNALTVWANREICISQITRERLCQCGFEFHNWRCQSSKCLWGEEQHWRRSEANSVCWRKGIFPETMNSTLLGLFVFYFSTLVGGVLKQYRASNFWYFFPGTHSEFKVNLEAWQCL